MPILNEKKKSTSSGANDDPSLDASAMSAICAGDEQAMARVYERYSEIVYAVALRILGDCGAAEDVLQEVFMLLWRSPNRFDATRGSLGGWLAAVARNRSIDLLRKRRTDAYFADLSFWGEPEMIRGDDWIGAAGKIQRALASMPVSQRSALEMAFFEGFTHTEIAEKTGEPLGTIKTRIRFGLRALRKALNP